MNIDEYFENLENGHTPETLNYTTEYTLGYTQGSNDAISGMHKRFDNVEIKKSSGYAQGYNDGYEAEKDGGNA